MKQSHCFLIDDEHVVKQFTQSMIENSVEVFHIMRKLQNQVRQHDIITSFSFIASSSSVYQELNSQSLVMIAQIITQTLYNQSFFVVQVSANSIAVLIFIRFKKLFDISEYEKNKDYLNV